MKNLLLILLFLVAGHAIAQETKSQLVTRFDVIRNETAVGGNTKTRIANAYQELSDGTIGVYPIESTGTNTYIGSLVGIDGYNKRIFFVTFQNNNTGSSTLNINSIGAVAIQKEVSGTWTNLSSGDIIAGKLYRLYHDGARFQIDLGGSGGGAVSSVFTRTGAVTAQTGDYAGSQITNTPAGGISSTNTQDAINELDTEKQPLNSNLTTFGGLTPSANDVLQYKSGAWINRTPAQLKIDLSLTKGDVGLSNVENTALSTWTGNGSIATVGNLVGGSTGNGFTINAGVGQTAFTGQIPFANLADVAALYPQEVTYTASHTALSTSDLNKIIYMNSASATNFQIDPGSFPVGSFLNVRATGGGTCTAVQGSGVTINPQSGSLTLSSTAVNVFYQKTLNNWELFNGDPSGGGGAGTVTDVSVVTANGVSGSVANSTSTPAITLSLGAITPTSVNSVVLSGSSTPTLAVTGTSSISGANTGDQTSVSGNAGTATALQTPRTIGIITGDATSSGSSFDGTANNTNAITLATVNSNVGTFGSATQSNTITVNGKGLVTGISSQTVTPAIGSVTGLGTGIASALANNTGTAGAPVLFNGAGGTPSSINLSNATNYPSATESLQGIAEIATQAETDAGTDDARIVTALKRKVTNARKSTKTGNYTITSSDDQSEIIFNSATDAVITIGTQTDGYMIAVTNTGIGAITFTGSGVTLTGAPSLPGGVVSGAFIRFTSSSAAYVISASSVGWSQISGKPTTISSFGITDGSYSINAQYTSVGNIGTGEDVLYTYTVPGGTLSANGHSISMYSSGTFATSANNKRIRVKFGATTIFDTGALAITTASDWSIKVDIIRTGTATQRCSVSIITSSSVLSSSTDYTTSAETMSGNSVLQITGEATSDNDVTGEMFKVKKEGI